jgi:hypothetical protein
MYVVNRSPFWFELRAAGGDPVAIIESWEQTSFPIPSDTRTFVLTPYEMNGNPIVDFSSDLLNMVLVDTSCDNVSGSTHTPIISASVPLSISSQATVGGSSVVSAGSLVPFSGVPESISIDPVNNPWLTLNGEDLLLQRETDVTQSTSVNAEIWGAYVNPASAGSYFSMAVLSETFFSNNLGFNLSTVNRFGPYTKNDSYVLGAATDIVISGANIPGGSLTSYPITSPLGVETSVMVSDGLIATIGTVFTIGAMSATSPEVMYFYAGQKMLLWFYVVPDGLSGYIGMFDAANPANGVAFSWTANVAQSVGAPGISEGEVSANPPSPPGYSPPVGGTYDLSKATVILTPSIGVIASTSLHGHSLSRIYVGNSPVSAVNPIPIQRQKERLTQTLTTAALGASATYTQAWLDTQGPNLSDSYGNPGPSTVGSVAGEVFTNETGTLYVDTTDDTTNANLTVTTAYAISASTQTSIPRLNASRRYLRYRFVNGATAQGSFELTQTAFTDSLPGAVSHHTIAATTTVLAASATYTQPWVDSEEFLSQVSEGPRSVIAVAGMAYSDQAGTLYLDQTDDSSNANLIVSTAGTAVVAATAVAFAKTTLNSRYYRFRYVNGATAQTTFELTQTGFER